MNAFFRLRFGAFCLALAGIGLSGCGGGNSTALPSPSGSPPAPVLVPGATYQYSGTETVGIVYTTPTATNVNSNGVYTYTANQIVNPGASGAPAAFDVNRVTTYTATQTPASGEQLQSETSDTYENQTFAGATETVATVGSKTVTTGVDLNAALRLGNGPYSENTTAATTYVTPQSSAVYPLQTGATIVEPFARTVSSTTTDANAGGTYGGGGTTATTYNNDGSFTRTFQAGNGSSQQQQTVNSNGTAQLTVQTNGAQTQTTVNAPVSGIIPVTVVNPAGTQNDNAADWYPGGAQAPQPLVQTTNTVKGPATLPAACGFSGAAPPVIEVDINTTNLDPLGSDATTTERLFNSNGVNVCRLQTATTANYAVTTGALTSTTTTTIVETLSASNQTITGVKRLAGS